MYIRQNIKNEIIYFSFNIFNTSDMSIFTNFINSVCKLGEGVAITIYLLIETPLTCCILDIIMLCHLRKLYLQNN